MSMRELDSGRELTFLSAFPMMRSDSPLEYMLAVSQVVIPLSHAAFNRGRA
jgi:hypothetical protein